MFGFWKHKKGCELYAPVRGRQIALEETPDPVFAKKMMGEGTAFLPAEDILYAPCSGELLMVAETGHALGIRAENGMEILIHIGMDTVALNGEGFQVLTGAHRKIKAHQPLIRLDRERMLERGIDLTTPMVITNGQEFDIVIKKYRDPVDTGKVVLYAGRKIAGKSHESDQEHQ